MPLSTTRAQITLKAARINFAISVLVACIVSILVFLVWYPHPYGLLSGGLHLFLILVGVDVVCGPLLTLVLFNPKKSRRELFSDMALVVLIQLAALVYGLHTVYEARPLFLVHEVDRFKVIALPDYGEEDVHAVITALDPALRPHPLKGPVVVGLRDPKDEKEQEKVLFESIAGGRDYAQRPEFYIPYDNTYQAKALARAKPLTRFIAQHPDTTAQAQKMLAKANMTLNEALFLPVQHRQDWVAVLAPASAHILGFLPGSGFDLR